MELVLPSMLIRRRALRTAPREGICSGSDGKVGRAGWFSACSAK